MPANRRPGPSRPRVSRPFISCLAAAAVGVAFAPTVSSSASAASDRLRITFDADAPSGGQYSAGSAVADSSGHGNNGVVRTAHGGSVARVSGGTDVVADFPGKCSNEPCPNALIEIADSPSLDPGSAAFSWGARVRLLANETDDGENIVQKGLWGQSGGQWKLQVDKAAGRPSCVVSGKVRGEAKYRRVVLKSSVGIANGAWHQVVCHRSSAAIQIVVDGVVRGSASMPAVVLDNAASVTIGAKAVQTNDNDQFHGQLDDVFMTVL